ncbi:hypothetical protein BDW59DRAFT_146457 [Aspergillus cavernicola]|uniref:Uncharacterized protein n=1 Tax=Aspergillus cavernicola TaxID=176166 RepID=A0ABR4IDZ5_9EURO
MFRPRSRTYNRVLRNSPYPSPYKPQLITQQRPFASQSKMEAKSSNEHFRLENLLKKYEGKVPARRPGKDQDIVVDGGYVLAV